MDLPGKYGSYKTCLVGLGGLSIMGVWSKILEPLIAMGYSNGRGQTKIGLLWIVLLLIHVTVTGQSLLISLVVGPGD